MYTILVAIDGSECSQRAVRYAARRAKETPCKVDLLHVEKPVMAWEIGPVSSLEDVTAVREGESRKLLEAAVGEFGPTAVVDKLVVSGEAAATILEHADRRGVDEIVMGSRGMRPLGAAMLGSVAYKVLHEAKVAVVVVR
jgi:nucleotide-binding universal stress UspA family protein